MKLHGDRQAFSAHPAVPLCDSRASGARRPLVMTAMTALVAMSAAFAAITTPTVAHAQSNAYRDDTTTADQAIASHEWTLAIAELDKRIASSPRDVQARFKRATLLARLGRDDEAMKAFTQITQTYPELPEPYNNLAALYAKHGQYQEARATLETALAANPNFALARRNLGDIYLRLAAESYQRAAKQAPSDRLAAARAQAVETLVAGTPANSRRLAAPIPPVAASMPHTSAQPLNSRSFLPSMGGQPPLFVPDANGDTTTPTP